NRGVLQYAPTKQTEMYQMALNDLRGHLEKIPENPGLIDLILDGDYLSSLPQLAERTASPFIINYCLEYQKLMGILFSWRASTKVSGGGVTPPLPGYEKMAEDTLMERLEAARSFVFGPERVFGYLKGLETETLNLRLAIGGRLQGIPPEDINRRLHKGYV
ncbi:MAG: V-type ATPase subunit, partial [Candidatus Brocadiaceae bacterium]|nr:V-type ATPase subunit [Candidatus Brocadiaceae bacterium]